MVEFAPAALLLVLVASSCTPLTISEKATGIKVLYEKESRATYAASSPNGKYVAHLGASSTGPDDIRGLWITNVDESSADTEVIDAVGTIGNIGEPAFAPDNLHIALVAGDNPGASNPETANIFRLNISRPSPIQMTDICLGINCIATGPLIYSPDGSKIAYQVRTREEENNLTPPTPSDMDDITPSPLGELRICIAIMRSDARLQHPKMLHIGTPLYWSTDGNSIYYSDGNNKKGYKLYRFDLRTKKSIMIVQLSVTQDKISPPASAFILGKVPEEEAFFVLDGGSSVSIKSLSSSPIANLPLTEAVKKLALKDERGRSLTSIQAVGKQRLFLTYNRIRYDKAVPMFHFQMVEY